MELYVSKRENIYIGACGKLRVNTIFGAVPCRAVLCCSLQGDPFSSKLSRAHDLWALWLACFVSIFLLQRIHIFPFSVSFCRPLRRKRNSLQFNGIFPCFEWNSALYVDTKCMQCAVLLPYQYLYCQPSEIKKNSRHSRRNAFRKWIVKITIRW